MNKTLTDLIKIKRIKKQNYPKRILVTGFTLMEFLVVLVIIGILMTITYPSYQTFLLKSRRADALAVLSQDQIFLERCYSQNFSYKGSCGALPIFPQTSPQGFYSISISNTGTSTYTLTATPTGTQALDTTCASITVNQANVKTATNSSGTAQTTCWSLN